MLLYLSIGYEQNFRKYSHGQVDRLGAPYDKTSLMHLPRNSWSRNGKNTIESRAGAHVVLGQMYGLSVVDKQQLNQLYKCKNNYGKKYSVFYQKNIEFLTALDSYRDVFQSSAFTRLLPRCRSWKRPNNRFTAGCQLFQELLWAAPGSVTSDRGTKGEWGLVCFEKCDRRISPGEFFLLFCLRIKLVPFTGQLSQFYISVLVRLR